MNSTSLFPCLERIARGESYVDMLCDRSTSADPREKLWTWGEARGVESEDPLLPCLGNSTLPGLAAGFEASWLSSPLGTLLTRLMKLAISGGRREGL